MALQASGVARSLSVVRETPAPSPGKEMTVCTNPATGEIIGKIPLNNVEDVMLAVKKAKLAQPAWQALPLKKRVEYIHKIGQYIQLNSVKIAETITRDNGKTLNDAMISEVTPAALATLYYCKNAARFLKDRKLKAGNVMLMNKRSRIVRVPYGVVGIISPWNYPFAIPYSEVIMTLLAGNAVILKTASETQLVGDMLKQCIESAGLPKDIFTYVNLPGSLAGDAFIDVGVDKLFFTGSVMVGKYLMKKASERLTPLVLELGGNDPMIVCEDADLYRAACGVIWAGMGNAGQSCGGIERIYVDKKVYHEFLSILKRRVEALRVGDGLVATTDVGPMTTERQMKTVREHVMDALAKGAKIYAQSSAPENTRGQYLPCMVLTDVNHDMLVMKDETFGPVVGVMPYETIDEAIALANDSNLGLNGSVWSKNRKKAMEIGRRIMAGGIMINDHMMSHGLAETPYGGFKESAMGRSHGEIGFNEVTQPQVIVDDILSTLPFARRNFWWQPYDRQQFEGMKGLIDLFYGRGILERIKGFMNVSSAFNTTFVKK